MRKVLFLSVLSCAAMFFLNSCCGVELEGPLWGHTKVLLQNAAGAVAPGGVDVILRAIQRGYSPDVGVIHIGVAVNALQLQKQVIGAGVAVAHGKALGRIESLV